jgi:hypothetical protein
MQALGALGALGALCQLAATEKQERASPRAVHFRMPRGRQR